MTRRRRGRRQLGKQGRGGKSAVQANKADSGSGRGRVALAQTIVVGRVYIQRMERTGMDRRDAGIYRKAAQRTWVGKKGRTPTGAGAQNPPHSAFPEARGGLKHHTVISCAWHLPWVPGHAGASNEAGAGREKVHPTKHRGTAERERSTTLSRNTVKSDEP